MSFKRVLTLNLPQGKSVFLWGARKTGKSTYLKEEYPNSTYIDFLYDVTFLQYHTNPSVLRDIAYAQKDKTVPIIIDEVQKVPAVLDEVHSLIESGFSFILCGSSWRKIKHTGANLLGGRAWIQEFLPLCFPEMPTFDLLRIFNHGLLPAHFASDTIPTRDLEGYVAGYIIPETQWESRMRHLDAFHRFLEALAMNNGEILNYTNLARECHVSVKTVQGYVDILTDMFLGYRLYPFIKNQGRADLVLSPKFYFFDTALPLVLSKRTITQLKGPEAGHAFEHYIYTELIAYRAMHQRNMHIEYWRTRTGLEVDFVLNRGEIAIETKITVPAEKRDLKGLLAFDREYKPKKLIVVGLEDHKRMMQIDDSQIWVYPVKEFLKELWASQIL